MADLVYIYCMMPQAFFQKWYSGLGLKRTLQALV